MSGPIPLVSVVVPVHNEEPGLGAFHEALVRVLRGLDVRYEVLYVDDGSTDGSLHVLKGLQGEDACVTVVVLSRNLGHQTALTAGMDHSSGDAVAMMDADLQHPPELIGRFLELWRAGAKIVTGVREETESISWVKSLTSRLYYRAFNLLSPSPIQPNAADFRLLDRQAVDVLRSMKERRRFLRGMLGWLGLPEAQVPFTAPPRAKGRSKYTWRKQMRMALDGIVAFSTVPLRLALWVGMLALAANVVYAAYVLYVYYWLGIAARGWSSIILLVGFLGSIQLILLGVIGEYIGSIYEEIKQRPLYLVREVHPPREPAGIPTHAS